MKIWLKRSLLVLLIFLLGFGQLGLLGTQNVAEAATIVYRDGATYFVDHDNWGGGDPNSAADNDMDSTIGNGDSKYMIDMKIPNVTTKPEKNAILLVRAFDVDVHELNTNGSNKASTGEWDRIYMSSNAKDIELGPNYTPFPLTWSTAQGYDKEVPSEFLVGALSGQNNYWNTTAFELDSSMIQQLFPSDDPKDLFLANTTHHYFTRSDFNKGWTVIIDWAQLVIDGGSKEFAELSKAQLKVETNEISVDTSFMAKESGNYSMEVSVIERVVESGVMIERNQGTDYKLFSNVVAGDSKDWTINIGGSGSTIDPSKEYIVNMMLFKDRGIAGGSVQNGTSPGEAQHVISLSTHDLVAGDFSKLANRDVTTSFRADDFQDNFFEISGLTPNGQNLQRIVIETLADTSKGHLELNGVPVWEGIEIAVADLDKLTFVPWNSKFQGTVTFTWNGYDNQGRLASEAGTITIVVGRSPEVNDLTKEVELGRNVAFTADDFSDASHFNDLDGDDLVAVKFIIPSNLNMKGIMTFERDSSTITMFPSNEYELTPVELVTLVFTPASNLADNTTVTIPWYGYDGRYYSVLPADMILNYYAYPSGQDQTIIIDEGTEELIITLSGKANGSATSVSFKEVVDDPTNGTLVATSNASGFEFVYTPNYANQVGTDTFTYTVQDDRNVVSHEATITIITQKNLNGWVGNKHEHDTTVMEIIPGEELKLSAMSSHFAEKVVANVNGIEVELPLDNASSWATDGYKKWVTTSYNLPANTSLGEYVPVFTAYDGSNHVIQTELNVTDNKFEVVSATTNTPPIATLSSSVGGHVNAAFPITITFDKEVTGFSDEDLVVDNGTVSDVKAMDATTYTAIITPTTSGQTVTITVAAGAVTDVAGDSNAVSNTISFMYDTDKPMVTFGGFTNHQQFIRPPVEVSVSVSEAVYWLDGDLLTSVNGLPLINMMKDGSIFTDYTASYDEDSKTFTLIFNGTLRDGGYEVNIAGNMVRNEHQNMLDAVSASFTVVGIPDTPTYVTSNSNSSSSNITTVRSTDGRLTLPVGSAGEVSLDGKIFMTIPAHANSQLLEITIKKVANTQELPVHNGVAASELFDIQKNFLGDLNKSATLTLVFDSTELNSGQTVAIFYYNEPKHEWVKMEGGIINGNRISVEVKDFNRYAVLVIDQVTGLPIEAPSADELTKVNFDDIVGHWAESTLKQVVQQGIIKGYTDGSLRPNGVVTRSEFVTMLMNALKPASEGITLSFVDTEQIPAWSKQAVSQVVEAGIATGYTDGNFRPYGNITRNEIAVMIARAYGTDITTLASTGFSDDREIPDWARGAVFAMRQLGIVKGRSNNNFAPDGMVTRAEAVTMIMNLLQAKRGVLAS